MMETIFLPTKDRIVVYHLMAHTIIATTATTMGVLDTTPATMGVLVIIAVYQLTAHIETDDGFERIIPLRTSLVMDGFERDTFCTALTPDRAFTHAPLRLQINIR